MITSVLDRFLGRLQDLTKYVYDNKFVKGGLIFVLFVILLLVTHNVIFSICIIFISAMAYTYPLYGVYFLSLYIPIKYFLKTGVLTPELMVLVIPLTLLAIFLGSLPYNKQKNTTPVDKLLFLLFIASLVSTFGSVYLYGPRLATLLDFLVWLQLVGFYLVGRQVISKDNLKQFALVNLSIANLVAIFALIQSFVTRSGYSPWIDAYETIGTRLSGSVGNPNALAGYLMMVILIGFAVLIGKRKSKNIIMTIGLFILPTLALALTFSRGAIVVTTLSILVILVQKRMWKILALGALLSLIIIFLSPVSAKNRFTGAFSGQGLEYSIDSGRVWALNNVFYINRHHFFFGSGWGSYGGEYAYRPLGPTYLEGLRGGSVLVANTDNQWLQVYAQQGIMGIWLYALIIYEIAKKHYKKPLFAAFLGFLLWGLFVDSFQFYQASFFGFILLGHLSTSESQTVLE